MHDKSGGRSFLKQSTKAVVKTNRRRFSQQDLFAPLNFFTPAKDGIQRPAGDGIRSRAEFPDQLTPHLLNRRQRLFRKPFATGDYPGMFLNSAMEIQRQRLQRYLVVVEEAPQGGQLVFKRQGRHPQEEASLPAHDGSGTAEPGTDSGPRKVGLGRNYEPQPGAGILLQDVPFLIPKLLLKLRQTRGKPSDQVSKGFFSPGPQTGQPLGESPELLFAGVAEAAFIIRLKGPNFTFGRFSPRNEFRLRLFQCRKELGPGLVERSVTDSIGAGFAAHRAKNSAKQAPHSRTQGAENASDDRTGLRPGKSKTADSHHIGGDMFQDLLDARFLVQQKAHLSEGRADKCDPREMELGVKAVVYAIQRLPCRLFQIKVIELRQRADIGVEAPACFSTGDKADAVMRCQELLACPGSEFSHFDVERLAIHEKIPSLLVGSVGELHVMSKTLERHRRFLLSDVAGKAMKPAFCSLSWSVEKPGLDVVGDGGDVAQLRVGGELNGIQNIRVNALKSFKCRQALQQAINRRGQRVQPVAACRRTMQGSAWPRCVCGLVPVADFDALLESGICQGAG